MTGLETCPLSGKFGKMGIMKAKKGGAKGYKISHKRWTEEEYDVEMEHRFQEMEQGKVKTLTLEDLETSARESYKKYQEKRK